MPSTILIPFTTSLSFASLFFFFNATATTEIYTLSLHDALPIWIAPVQVQLITIADAQIPYAEEIRALLLGRGIRVEADLREEKMGAKIRDAELLKIPYMLVLGKQEVESRAVSVRSRKKGNEGSVALDAFVEKLVAEIAAKT